MGKNQTVEMLDSDHADQKPFAEEGYAFMAAVFEVHRERWIV
jgi:hypothetical protein